MSRIAITAPYTRETTTRMACVVADCAEGLGHTVEYLSTRRISGEINRKWDSRVRSMDKLPDYINWAKGFDQFVWFDTYSARMRVTKHAINTLVCCGHRMTREHLNMLGRYQYLVAPTTSLAPTLHKFSGVNQQYYILWDAGSLITRSFSGTKTPSQMRLLVSLDGRTLVDEGMAILGALQVLLDQYSGLVITLLHTTRWTREGNVLTERLLQRYGDRVGLLRQPAQHERTRAIREHDWVLCPSVAPVAGLDAMEALYLGVPVIVHDIPPYSEFVKSGYNGVVLPALTRENWIGASSVDFNTHILLEGLTQVLADEHYLRRLQQQPWRNLAQVKSGFQSAWSSIWNTPHGGSDVGTQESC